ncbi:uncharacterized protein LOC103392839 isoform X3 [Cynoglossus semilaevis]|uniref:uncharacterized protein LOC103392839 isoform X3 n=1 Tax=Cynoglossus semilaevis TaxID=244447 RepID=UPI000D624310|nr:uncharacterized protein LOC103392839 isoform X3 [Cynoglossus semilaevis]
MSCTALPYSSVTYPGRRVLGLLNMHYLVFGITTITITSMVNAGPIPEHRTINVSCITNAQFYEYPLNITDDAEEIKFYPYNETTMSVGSSPIGDERNMTLSVNISIFRTWKYKNLVMKYRTRDVSIALPPPPDDNFTVIIPVHMVNKLFNLVFAFHSKEKGLAQDITLVLKTVGKCADNNETTTGQVKPLITPYWIWILVGFIALFLVCVLLYIWSKKWRKTHQNCLHGPWSPGEQVSDSDRELEDPSTQGLINNKISEGTNQIGNGHPLDVKGASHNMWRWLRGDLGGANGLKRQNDNGSVSINMTSRDATLVANDNSDRNGFSRHSLTRQ